MPSPCVQMPVIDFAPFIQGAIADRQRVADQIYEACCGIGVMYLSQHGIPQPLLDSLLLQSKHFFDLPVAQKAQITRSEVTNCGHVGLQKERLSPNDPGDLKEALNVGRQSVWLPGQEMFRQVASEFYQLSTTVVAPTILRAFAIALQLPETFFDDKHGRHYFLRLLHYPPIHNAPQAGQLRAGEHTDYGSISLLFQDEVGGLEVQTRQGEWIAAPPLPGTVLVNVGDIIQRWTNDRFRSTPHRVGLPTGEAMRRSRYSVALFCDPNPDVEITCLASCQTPEHPPLYAPILAGDYLNSRLTATY